MNSIFLRAYPPAQPASGPSYWLPFRNGEVIVQRQEQGVTLIRADETLRTQLGTSEFYYLGTLDGIPCVTCELDSKQELLPTWYTSSLRGLFDLLENSAYTVAAYAAQIIYWQRTNRYCPSCGHAIEATRGTWGHHCPRCGHTGYPPVSPAILVLIHDGGERVLLAHKPGWPAKRYSCIAGFVEPGESLEECVQREVYEEVGVEITAITYVGSQPWPFPHQLMVGYTARYVGGPVRIDAQELDDAAWFQINNLPDLPPKQSLAHFLITNWVATQQLSKDD